MPRNTMTKRAARKQLQDPSPARAAAYAAVYPMLQQVAKRHGYALAIHGTMHRDFDLIAVPWIEDASDRTTLIKALKKATKAVTWSRAQDRLKVYRDCSPTQKPHGRMAYSLHFTEMAGHGAYLDISVLPKTRVGKPRKTCAQQW